MIGDLPTITDSAHTHSVYGLANMNVPLSTIAGTTATPGLFRTSANVQSQLRPAMAILPLAKQEKPAMPARRLVQVFIADPDDNVPLDHALLYSGQQKFTDATDQELFFEIDMKAVLEVHNEKRAKIRDKKVKERTEFLEPAKIRDLKMVVVNIATF